MLAHLAGRAIGKIGDAVILDVNGVGYRVHVLRAAQQECLKGNTPVKLYVHLAVRENALDLYGFKELKELEFFEHLDAVSGIGPRSALSILSLADVETLESAIASGDTSYLTKVSGVGKKMAQKIVLELQDKLEVGKESTAYTRKDDEDTLLALEALGYSAKEGREALKKVPKEMEGASEKLREALKILGK